MRSVPRFSATMASRRDLRRPGLGQHLEVPRLLVPQDQVDHRPLDEDLRHLRRHGRGFAVVASEVKALAEQTAKATGEIGQQIGSIQAATQESVGAIQQISGTIEKLSEISSTIAAAVEEQGAATQEIFRNVQQAAEGTKQVSSNITDVQRGASETGSASSQVLSAAQSLSSDSNRLKLEVGKFLNSVRAA